MIDSPEPLAFAGIDGCPGGWAVARLEQRRLTIERLDSLDTIFEATRAGSLTVLAIDMPIGLLNDRSRSSDAAARKVLGPRRSSVFATPVRSTLEAADYVDACVRSRSASGKALSKQAFHLLPKIRHIDERIEPADQERIVEAHPECAFARLAGEPLLHPKATAAGRALRRQLLREALAPLTSTTTDDLIDAKVVPIIDLLDALVLLFTARHVAGGTERRLGGDLDPTGLFAEIVY